MFESKILVLSVKFAVDRSSIVMPGDNCSVFGCGTRRIQSSGNMEVTEGKRRRPQQLVGRFARGN